MSRLKFSSFNFNDTFKSIITDVCFDAKQQQQQKQTNERTKRQQQQN